MNLSFEMLMEDTPRLTRPSTLIRFLQIFPQSPFSSTDCTSKGDGCDCEEFSSCISREVTISQRVR